MPRPTGAQGWVFPGGRSEKLAAFSVPKYVLVAIDKTLALGVLAEMHSLLPLGQDAPQARLGSFGLVRGFPPDKVADLDSGFQEHPSPQ